MFLMLQASFGHTPRFTNSQPTRHHGTPAMDPDA
jgi:hypothetical protein